MHFNHDEIREMFPEYLKGSLSEDKINAIEVHIRDCPACRSELSLISELVSIDAPDPGNLFWATLPQKMKVSVKGIKAYRFSVKSLLFRYVPVAAALAVLVVFLLTVAKRNGFYELDPYFNDPFTISYLDYSDLTEEDMNLLTEQAVGDELYIEPDDVMEYSYHREFASLSSGEMDSLYEVLKTEQKIGG